MISDGLLHQNERIGFIMASIKRRPLLDRFQEKVEISKDNEWNGTPCWDWTATRDTKGYGQISIESKTTRAHRVSWEILRGEIPEGLLILHRCDRPCCVNPDHLFLGTSQDNADDKVLKDRQYKAKGSNNGFATLTESDVRIVKQFLRRHSGYGVGSFLGGWFGVTLDTISDINRGRSWTHVE